MSTALAIIVRQDLWLRRGTELCSAFKAALTCIFDKADMVIVEMWISENCPSKVYAVRGHASMEEIIDHARRINAPYAIAITNDGEPAVISIGPDTKSRVDEITDRLSEY